VSNQEQEHQSQERGAQARVLVWINDLDGCGCLGMSQEAREGALVKRGGPTFYFG
jgi:hypothetical protein